MDHPPLSDRVRRVIAPPIVAFKARHPDTLDHPDAIDLSQAAPSYPPPPPAVEALRRAAESDTARRYTPDPGLPDTRVAIAAYLARRHGAHLGPEHVLVTPGANAAFHLVSHALFDAGERVFLLTPYYFNHPMSLELLGARVEEVRLPFGVSVTRALQAGALDAVSPRATLVVVNPSNPSGRALTEAETSSLTAWAREREVRLVVDETYLEFFPAEVSPTTALASPGWDADHVVIGSFSKSLALPGDRVGFVAAHPRVIEETLKVQDAAVVCAPHVGQLAVTAGLQWPGLDAWLAERRSELHQRVDAFRDAFTGGRILAAGAFFAYVEGPGLNADRLATAAHVLALPGHAFGSSEHERIRISVGNAGVDEIRRAAFRINQLAADS